MFVGFVSSSESGARWTSLSRCTAGMPCGSASGPVRGLAILEPFSQPPCGAGAERIPKRSRTARELRDQGCTPYELRIEWGFSAGELAQVFWEHGLAAFPEDVQCGCT